MNFTLKQLQIFMAVVQYGSTLAASQALQISQPAVSSSISGLEKKLGTKLFYRWKKRMVLSEKGRNLLPQARSLLANAGELERMFSDEATRISGTLRLGASRTLASYVMPEILSDFAGDHSAVQVEMISRNKTGIIAQVEDFSLDVGIIAGTSTRPNVRNIPWLTDELCVFCSTDHPLAQKEELTEKELMESAWILREEGSGTLEVFYRALPEKIKPLNVTMVFDNIESIKRAVEKLDVLSCVSRFALQREVAAGRLKILPTPFLDLRRNYSFLIHRERDSSQLLNYFIHSCHGFASE